MNKINNKKQEQLGVSASTLSNQLKKALLFKYVKLAGHNYCFQCGAEIENVKDLSVEHKTPWLDTEKPKELFMDLDNIAFSHLSCNVRAARPSGWNHGTDNMMRTGCKCQLCVDKRKLTNIKQKEAMKKLRAK